MSPTLTDALGIMPLSGVGEVRLGLNKDWVWAALLGPLTVALGRAVKRRDLPVILRNMWL